MYERFPLSLAEQAANDAANGYVALWVLGCIVVIWGVFMVCAWRDWRENEHTRQNREMEFMLREFAAKRERETAQLWDRR